jgi:hypothetical protein
MDLTLLLSRFWFIIVFISGYCIPLVIAIKRQHHSAMAIAAVNILLGWTVIGWICAFVWSLTPVHPALRKESVLRLAE